MSKLIPFLKYYAAHTAAFGGLAMVVVSLYNRDLAGATTAFVAAMAGFGVNIKPGL